MGYVRAIPDWEKFRSSTGLCLYIYSHSLGFSFDDDGSLVNIKPISVSESESDNLEVPSMVHFNLFCFLKFIPLMI